MSKHLPVRPPEKLCDICAPLGFALLCVVVFSVFFLVFSNLRGIMLGMRDVYLWLDAMWRSLGLL